MAKRKIVIITTSPIPYGNNITDGPGYRAWNLFHEISKKHGITILSLYESFHQKLPKEFEISEDNILIKCASHKPKRVANLIIEEKPDILYLPWSATPFISRLRQKIPTIIDYVGVGLLESYISQGYVPIHLLQIKLKSFWLGDFLMTAGFRERYYLLGLLIASKRLSLGAYKLNDPLIHVIPMTPPTNRPLLQKKVIDKSPHESIILVAGAFLPWYDYPTFFQALNIISNHGVKNFRVILMGGNPKDPKFEKAVKKMIQNSSLEKKIIHTGLVPFKERANFYLASDIAVNIPPATVEDELSVRTRIIDYLWGKLPIVTPARDEYSNIVIKHGAGFSYSAGNPVSLAQVLETLTEDPTKLDQAKNNIENLLRNYFDIKRVISPLEEFINHPYVNPDRSSPKRLLPELFLWARDAFHAIHGK